MSHVSRRDAAGVISLAAVKISSFGQLALLFQLVLLLLPHSLSLSSCPPNPPSSLPPHHLALQQTMAALARAKMTHGGENNSQKEKRGERDRNNLIKSNYRAINHNTGFWGRVDEGRGAHPLLMDFDWLAAYERLGSCSDGPHTLLTVNFIHSAASLP